MKKIEIIMFVFLLLPTVLAAPDITVQVAYTNPYPVEPGNKIVVGMEVSNTGTDAANNLEITLIPRYPFELLKESTQTITSLNSGGVRIIEYDMFVDTSAVSTVYQLPVKIKYSGSNDITKNINIRVKGRPNLNLIEVSDFSISRGDMKNMNVKITNLGTGKAKRVIATLESSNENIKTILSGGNVYVGDINPGETKEAVFQIYVDSDTGFGVYSSVLKLVYEDESGNTLNKSFSLGILVGGEPDIRIIKVGTDPSKNELSVEIVNQGNAEARGIKGELIKDSAIMDVDYISKINPDKSAILKYDIPKTKDNSITLRLTYNGPKNDEYEKTEIIKWNNVSNKSSWFILIFLIVLGYIIIKKEIHKKFLHLFKKRK